MIQLPQRSVTRFFIPLIDVLTLLFCIFLVMPIIGRPEGDGSPEADARTEQIRELTEEVARLRQVQPDLKRQVVEELSRLRQEKVQVLKDRLAVRVLEIDGTAGKLYYRNPERVEIRNQADARALIDRDRRERGVGRRELYYLILYPRDRGSDYPTEGQRQAYERWFDDVALAFDVPGSALDEGRRP